MKPGDLVDLLASMVSVNQASSLDHVDGSYGFDYTTRILGTEGPFLIVSIAETMNRRIRCIMLLSRSGLIGWLPMFQIQNFLKKLTP